MNIWKNEKVRNAIMLGGLCATSYLAVYIARNILGVVTPQMIESGFTEEYVGTLSSLYFIFYAVGQLINGMIGDKIKAKYMISFGLILAGVGNLLFVYLSGELDVAKIVYAMTGFFLSMIYAPMTKVVAENTEQSYAVRCSLGYTFASFLGSPIAGILAALLVWQSVFKVGSGILFVMGAMCFVVFTLMEKRGIVTYNKFDYKKEGNNSHGIKVLLEHQIVKYTLISIVTGVVRTTVVFWMPTYLSQYLGFSSEQSATIFTVTTFVISMTTFIGIFIYERFNHNMDLTVLLGFIFATISFFAVFIVKTPIMNIIFMVIAIMSSGIAATMLWSRYCPGLRDTGMVSGATGFLDFVSYMSASASSTIFANAVTTIGWRSLILVWMGLMAFGVIISLPFKRK